MNGRGGACSAQSGRGKQRPYTKAVLRMKCCTICKKEFNEAGERSDYAEAGEWLAGEVWQDEGELCPLCLENRAKLVMMYCHEYNS